MKNLNRFASLLLCITVILSMCATAFAAVSDTGFSDVEADAWYAEAVTYCSDNDLMAGVTDTAFAPNRTMTRAMLATALYRIAGQPEVSGSDSFTDTQSGLWYSNAVLWASAEGIIAGYGNGLFGPDVPVAREQIASILWRYEGSPAAEAGAAFTDSNSISDWAESAVQWARTAGIVSGKGENMFDPKGSVTRSEVAMILMNYLSNEDPGQTTEEEPEQISSDQISNDEPEQVSNEGSKILVAYFSCTGNTETIASYIAEAMDADIYEIIPQEAYTSADLNYSDSSSRSTVEQNNASVRPAISGNVENMADYDVVFLGYPIWFGQSPRIISTFLESYDFSGKTIVPFCTSTSSGIGSSDSNLHNLVQGAEWLAGRRFDASASSLSVSSWAQELGI